MQAHRGSCTTLAAAVQLRATVGRAIPPGMIQHMVDLWDSAATHCGSHIQQHTVGCTPTGLVQHILSGGTVQQHTRSCEMEHKKWAMRNSTETC